MEPFRVHTGLVAPMDRENVDTDAIIPKQFLKSIRRTGFGPNLFYYLRRDITGLTVTAPDGTAPHSLAQRGYYMMFALNTDGVPSTATWVHLS